MKGKVEQRFMEQRAQKYFGEGTVISLAGLRAESLGKVKRIIQGRQYLEHQI